MPQQHADFAARLGRADHPGLLPWVQCLEAIAPGANPYVTGDALPGNSPVFAGREDRLHQVLAHLRRPDKPGSVSVLGERRMGKSSFLRQVLEELDRCPDFLGAAQYGALLKALQAYAAADALADLARLPKPEPIAEAPHLAWLTPGWELLAQLAAALGNLDEYPGLRTESTRRDWLRALNARLLALKEGKDADSWLPYFWPEIRTEILDIWLAALARETQQAREWLRLEVALTEDHLALGSKQVGLVLRNPTDQLARDLRLNIEETGAGLFWQSREHQLRLLEGGETLRVELPVTADNPGDYTVRGVLEARDLEERPYRLPFTLRLSVAARGRRYQACPIQPYETGSGLGSDRTFVGRGDLIEWLAAQWRSPDTRQGVVLVG